MLPGIVPMFNSLQKAPLAIHDIGAANANSAATYTLTLTAAVPAGSCIVVGYVERASGGANPSIITDSAGNTYVTAVAPILGSGNGPTALLYAKNSLALPIGGTITCTTKQSLNSCISAAYLTGVSLTAPLDAATLASASPTTSTPSITSGTPAVAGEMMIGYCFTQGTSSYTQDTAHGWASPPDYTSSGSGAGAPIRQVLGGYLLNPAAAAVTYAPTFGSSGNTAIIVAGFH